MTILTTMTGISPTNAKTVCENEQPAESLNKENMDFQSLFIMSMQNSNAAGKTLKVLSDILLKSTDDEETKADSSNSSFAKPNAVDTKFVDTNEETDEIVKTEGAAAFLPQYVMFFPDFIVKAEKETSDGQEPYKLQTDKSASSSYAVKANFPDTSQAKQNIADTAAFINSRQSKSSFIEEFAKLPSDDLSIQKNSLPVFSARQINIKAELQNEKQGQTLIDEKLIDFSKLKDINYPQKRDLELKEITKAKDYIFFNKTVNSEIKSVELFQNKSVSAVMNIQTGTSNIGVFDKNDIIKKNEGLSSKDISPPPIDLKLIQEGRENTEVKPIQAAQENNAKTLLNTNEKSSLKKESNKDLNPTIKLNLENDFKFKPEEILLKEENALPSKNNTVLQLADRTVKALNRNISSFNMKLTPEGLGEVNVNIQFLDGKLNIKIQTEFDTTKNLLESQINTLETELKANNYSIFNLDISSESNKSLNFEGFRFSDRENNQWQHNSQQRDFKEQNLLQQTEPVINIPISIFSQNRLNYVV